MNNTLPHARKLLNRRLKQVRANINRLMNSGGFEGSKQMFDTKNKLFLLGKEHNEINIELGIIKAMNKGAVK